MQPALIDWQIASRRASVASDLESLSPYLEAPSIPEGVTVDEYRRARPPETNPLLDHLLGWLRHLRPTAAPAGPAAGAEA
jgi:hypothetical protein